MIHCHGFAEERSEKIDQTHYPVVSHRPPHPFMLDFDPFESLKFINPIFLFSIASFMRFSYMPSHRICVVSAWPIILLKN